MSKDSTAHILHEEHKGIADNLVEQDTIRRCDAEASAAAVKHEQKIEAKHHHNQAKDLKHQAKQEAKDLKDAAKETAKALKDQTKANAEKVKH